MRTSPTTAALTALIALAGSALPLLAQGVNAPAQPNTSQPPAAPPVEPAPIAAIETIDEQLDALEGRPVRAVTLKGILAEDEPLTRNQVRVAAGGPMSAGGVREDVRRLSRLGRFERIEARVQPFSDGTVEVIYTFTPAPIIRNVFATGNREVSDADLAAAVGLLANTPANPYLLDQAKRRVVDLYQKRGYYQADVQIDERELREQGIVSLRIREGDRLRITDIRFEGNASIEYDELRSKVQSKTWGIFSGGTYEESQVSRDVAAVEEWYKNRGYLRAQVDRQVQPSPDGKEAILTFVVSEGPRFTVRSVQVLQDDGSPTGGTLPPEIIAPEQAAGLIPLKAGDIYAQDKVKRSIDALRDAYGQMGYVDTQVRTLDRQSTEAAEADLILLVREGKRSMTGLVTVKGNEYTQTRVIRRQIKALPERPLDTLSLRESERRLEALRIFQPQSVRITPQPEQPGSPGVRDVLVELAEGDTGSLGFGAAASSDGGVVGSITLTQRNFGITDWPDSVGEFLTGRAFRGEGQTFILSAQPGSQISTYSVTFSDPYIFETDYSAGLTAFVRERVYREYDENRQGAALTIGRRLGDRWSLSLTPRLENVEINDIDDDAAVDVYDVEGENSITGLAVKLRRAALDRSVRPTRGTIVELSAEQVGVLGGDYDFTKFGAEGSLYVPVDEDALGLRTVLLLRTSIFYIPQDEDDVPVYERFYQGGREFRGFKFRGLGPRAPRNDNPAELADDSVGGTWSFFAGAQLEKPLIDQFISGVTFVDSGTLTNQPGFDDYRVSVGAGLRVYIPALGPVPLAFDFAVPVLKQDGDQQRIFSFSLDLPFQ